MHSSCLTDKTSSKDPNPEGAQILQMLRIEKYLILGLPILLTIQIQILYDMWHCNIFFLQKTLYLLLYSLQIHKIWWIEYLYYELCINTKGLGEWIIGNPCL